MMDEDSSIFWNRIPRRKRSNLNSRTVKTPWKVNETPKSFVTSSESSSPTRMRLTGNPNLPEWLVGAMKHYNGHNAKLVVKEKKLFKSDLDEGQCRLLLPLNQEMSLEYLTGEEIETLESTAHDKKKKGVNVVFLDPDSNAHNLELRKWIKNRVLTKGWKAVIITESLKVGDKLPLWSFRSKNENGILYFALVRNDRKFGSSSSHTGHKEESACQSDIYSPCSSKATENWVQVLEEICQMRHNEDAPDDPMECILPPKERRFTFLLGSFLSCHPKDQVLIALRRLYQNGLLTAEAIAKADVTTITNLIYTAGIETSKATYMKIVANTCLLKYNGDIPKSVDELKLMVYPNMAQLILDLAWPDLSFDDDSEFPLDPSFAGYFPTKSECEDFPIPA